MKKKIKIIIWGLGEKIEEVYSALDLEKCELLRIVDRDPKKQGTYWHEKYFIDAPEKIAHEDIDYFLISAQNSNSIIEYAVKMGIPREKFLPFWNNDSNIDFLKEEYVLKRENFLLRRRLQNAPYEYGMPYVHFMSNEELFRELIENGKSLSRFGDGEFEIIRGKKRGWFQENNSILAKKLEHILMEEQNQVIIGVADNFGNLDKYTDVAADGIREYLTKEVRDDVYKLLSEKRLYADAYITRPYFMYKDKTHIKLIIDCFRKLWRNRSVLIVENKYSRFGVNNDLLNDVAKIRRIICPNKNAFEQYSNILSTIYGHITEEDLVLISLGQTATVLSYELGMNGYQAIDIGQIDTEYEWYLSGATDRAEIPGKSVAELSWWHEPSQNKDEVYDRQIVGTVGD